MSSADFLQSIARVFREHIGVVARGQISRNCYKVIRRVYLFVYSNIFAVHQKVKSEKTSTTLDVGL